MPEELLVDRSQLPDRWMVRRIDRRINPHQNPTAWWIAANPRTGEGAIFSKHEWDKANAYASERNAEIQRREAERG